MILAGFKRKKWQELILDFLDFGDLSVWVPLSSSDNADYLILTGSKHKNWQELISDFLDFWDFGDFEKVQKIFRSGNFLLVQ